MTKAGSFLLARTAAATIAVLLTVFTVIGCATGSGAADTVVEAEPVKQVYDLALAFAEGATYEMRVSTSQNIEQTMLGTQVKTSQEMVTSYRLTVEGITEEQAAVVGMTYGVEDFVMSMTGPPMIKAELETAAANVNEMMEELKPGLVDIPIRFDVGRDGEIVSMEGMDSYRDLVYGTISDPETEAMVDEVLSGIMTNDYLAESWSLYFGHIPPGPVSVGDSWIRDLSVESGFLMRIDSTFTLTGVDADTFRVEIDGQITGGDGDAANMLSLDIPGVSVEMTLDGRQTGSVTANARTGWIESMEMVLDAKGEMTLSISGDEADVELEKIVVPFTLLSTTQIE